MSSLYYLKRIMISLAIPVPLAFTEFFTMKSSISEITAH